MSNNSKDEKHFKEEKSFKGGNSKIFPESNLMKKDYSNTEDVEKMPLLQKNEPQQEGEFVGQYNSKIPNQGSKSRRQ